MEKTINRLRKWCNKIEEMRNVLYDMKFNTQEAEKNEFGGYSGLYVESEKELSLGTYKIDISIESDYGKDGFTVMSRITHRDTFLHASETHIYEHNTAEVFRAHLEALEEIVKKLIEIRRSKQ